MPADFVACVDALLKEGKPKNSAYAICMVQYKKKHKGHTPQQDMPGEHNKMMSELLDLTPTEEELAAMAFLYEEVSRCRELAAKCKIKKGK